MTEWRCICGSGDDGEWHSAMCVASNTPDDEWYAEGGVWQDDRGWWYRLPGGIAHGPYGSRERAEDMAVRQRRVRERMGRQS